MNLRSLSKLNRRLFSSLYRPITSSSTPHASAPRHHASSFVKNPRFDKPICRCIHTQQEVAKSVGPGVDFGGESETDAAMNEFLSRFAWVMRKKLCEAYPDCDKGTIDGMLVIIVDAVAEKVGLEDDGGGKPPDFSEDLWRTVWEVSNVVSVDMAKEEKKEKMKGFLQSEEVKEMYRFAGQVGIRGDLLRELRFKWAREEMERSEFYRVSELARKVVAQQKSIEEKRLSGEIVDGEDVYGEGEEGKQKIDPLPKRHGKIKYKIYGLDLSNPKWAEVADKVHESVEVIWPEEAKPIVGKCKLATEKILSLKDEDDPAALLEEWKGLLQPSRIDWISFLDRLREHNFPLYIKISEVVLGEESFKANIRDYSKLIDILAKENSFEDAERILMKMNENGIQPDVITLTVVIQMYCKSGKLDHAKEAFESLSAHGFRPDTTVYSSMIIAYVDAGQPKLGESLLRSMEMKDITPTEEIYMTLFRSYAQCGDVKSADRISMTMQMAGFKPNLELCTLMVEAYGRAGDPDHARQTFDQMMQQGHKPNDRCIASMIAAYEKKNLLDKALDLLLELEKKGFHPGVATYTVLVDWFSKLELSEEAEQMLDKISEQGEAPPLKLHISLCDMYSKAGAEKKALQALGVLESKIEQLDSEEFERIITSLIAGGFLKDAQRLHGVMEARGFVSSNQLKLSLMASQAVGKSSKRNKSSF